MVNGGREKGFVNDSEKATRSGAKPWSKEWLILYWKAARKWTLDWVRDLIDTVTRRKPAATSYRFLAHQIEARFDQQEGPRSIVLSSADSEDVSTEVLLMIAYFLHDELGKKVLLVDGSFGFSDLSERLGFEGSAGLNEFLYGPGQTLDSLIKPLIDDQLYLLPRGKIKPGGSRHVSRETVSGMLASLDPFDYILFQQSSITNDTRYLVFAQEADLVLMYVEERRTLVSEFESNQKTFREYDIENVGFIMTGSN